MSDLVGQRVAVVGAGGIGCVLAVWSKQAGHAVTLCAHRPFANGLRVDGLADVDDRDIPTTTDPGVAVPVDIVFVTTKAQDTASVGPWLERLVEETTTVVVVQNGVDHEQRLRGLVPLEQVVPALAYIGAEQQQPGWVLYRGGNLLVLPSTPTADGIAEAFTIGPLLVRLEPDFKTAAWKKLLGNLVANPLTALTMGRIGVLHRPDMRQLADELLDEALAVANAEGADLDRSDADEVLDGLLSLPTTNGSSMLYDRLAGRALEHEYLTGTLVQLAEVHRIDVPLSRTVLALLRAIEPLG